MEVDESKPSLANGIVIRVVLGAGMLGVCLGLDLFLHAVRRQINWDRS
jgi:hypothetical protein